jgi:hypothetical protein
MFIPSRGYYYYVFSIHPYRLDIKQDLGRFMFAAVLGVVEFGKTLKKGRRYLYILVRLCAVHIYVINVIKYIEKSFV